MYQKASCELNDLVKIIVSLERRILNVLHSGLKRKKNLQNYYSMKFFSGVHELCQKMLEYVGSWLSCGVVRVKEL